MVFQQMIWNGNGAVWSLVNVNPFLLAQLLESNTLLKRTHGILSTLARAIVEKQHATEDNRGVINTDTTQDI
jgi:hypothetical protein